MRFIFRKIPPVPGQKRQTSRIQARTSSAEFGIRELRLLAAQAKIPGRNKLNKEDLAEALDRHYAGARIWIAWIARKERMAARSLTKARDIVNNRSDSGQYMDPITLEPLEPPIWIFKVEPNKEVHYSLANLIQYLFSSKTFKEPVTGLRFTDQHLREIDNMAHVNQIVAPNLLLLSRSNLPYQNQLQQNLIVGLERIAGDYIERFRQMIAMEPPFTDKQRTALYFNQQLHKEFLDVFRQLHSVDAEAANIAICQWCEFLRGPSHKPNKDPAKFMGPIVNWMNTLKTPVVPL